LPRRLKIGWDWILSEAELSKGLRLVLIGMIAVFAFGAAKAVDYVAGTPVRISRPSWDAEKEPCVVTFRLRNRTPTWRKVKVLITLYHSDDAPAEKAQKTICGYCAVHADLAPLNRREMTVPVASTKKATDCQVELEPSTP